MWSSGGSWQKLANRRKERLGDWGQIFFFLTPVILAVSPIDIGLQL